LLAGDVAHGAALRAVQRANLFLRTTLYDGNAISIREALFLGTRVIATDNGMRPTGVRLIPVLDVAALEASILNELSTAQDDIPTGQSGIDNLQQVLDLYRELDPEILPR
jgi:hypothetical protein